MPFEVPLRIEREKERKKEKKKPLPPTGPQKESYHHYHIEEKQKALELYNHWEAAAETAEHPFPKQLENIYNFFRYIFSLYYLGLKKILRRENCSSFFFLFPNEKRAFLSFIAAHNSTHMCERIKRKPDGDDDERTFLYR